jgi:glyoxylase-like metal-dependent hydrolase (beta-lactamase superfamily II)
MSTWVGSAFSIEVPHHQRHGPLISDGITGSCGAPSPRMGDPFGTMVGQVRVGAVTIEGVSDGSLPMPPTPMFNKTDQDWLGHSQFLNEDGMLPIEMGGFLVRSGERLILVDTGIGPHAAPERTGMFMRNLAALGVGPSEITDVTLTHLHFDHLGWATDGERRLFDEATYRCHEADWEFFMGTDPFDDTQAVSLIGGRTSSELLPPILDQLETWSEDETILPGIDVRSAPGHTPGSTVIVISSGTERALLLGDVVHCPAELLSDDWEMIGDVNRQLAQRTREALARELEGSDTPAAAAHFPGLQFGRLLTAQGRRQWTFG